MSHVWVHHPTGRKRQEAARAEGLREILCALRADGVTRVTIESRDHRQDKRDQSTILDVLKADREWKPDYRWAGKSEPLLWIPDALCGAIHSHLLDTDQGWFDRFRTAGAIPDPLLYRSGL